MRAAGSNVTDTRKIEVRVEEDKKAIFGGRETINLRFCQRRHSVACGACCHRCQMKSTMVLAGARIRGMWDQQ